MPNSAKTTTFPEPAGAVSVEQQWQLDNAAPGASPRPFRCFDGRSWLVELPGTHRDITVRITGIQYADGVVQRAVVVDRLDGYDDLLPVAKAQELARVLMAAVDEAQRMDARDCAVHHAGG
ncbi:hypothetical protein MXEN_05843 [Mycobacterium xenopi RIVM700367]|uniref:hypothetical protein n=1 Tax=Mycobacterium xenopi TaxID=1789 RepID=UPI00025AD794|nr:hypothetical protein [Mycobacterium xenopi]EID15714.1 hypothetical protein MXEN_05843 [Mycobacterium xenopi RIVM700367]